MKFKLRLLLSLLPFADPFADDGEAPFLRRNLRSEINRIFLFFFFFFFLKFLERTRNDARRGPFSIAKRGASWKKKCPDTRIDSSDILDDIYYVCTLDETKRTILSYTGARD